MLDSFSVVPDFVSAIPDPIAQDSSRSLAGQAAGGRKEAGGGRAGSTRASFTAFQ